MTPPRFSIRTMIVLVLVIAADCAVLRYVVSPGAPPHLWIGVMAILPMTNGLTIALYLFCHHRMKRPFLVGFLSAGLLAILVSTIFFHLAPRPWLRAFETTLDANFRTSQTYTAIQRQMQSSVYAKASIVALVQATMTALFTPPQVLLALVGGWLTGRFRIVVVRRKASNPGAQTSDPQSPTDRFLPARTSGSPP